MPKPIKTSAPDQPVFPDYLWTEVKDINPYLLEGQTIEKLTRTSRTPAEFLVNLERQGFYRINQQLQARWRVPEKTLRKARRTA